MGHENFDPLDNEKTIRDAVSGPGGTGFHGAGIHDVSLGDMPTQQSPGDSDLSMGELPTIVGSGASGAAQLESVELSDLYDVQGEIGHGGFATVFKAVDKETKQEVAIKRLKTEAADEQSVRRFKREARLIAEMDHPNIIGVHRIGEDSQGLYIVMEYVSGGSLKDYLKQNGRMPVRDAIKLIQQVCHGLAYAHRKNLIHRDIKPANILLAGNSKSESLNPKQKTTNNESQITNNFSPKIADFGLSTGGFESDMSMSLSMSGTTMGTPYYMPPEQRQNSKTVNHTADIYAIGKTLYQMVTGDVPDNVDPDLIPRPVGLKRIINQCVKTNPEERFFSMDDLAKALDTLVQRRRVLRPVLAGLLLVVVAGGFFGLRWKEQHDVALAEQARLMQMAAEQQDKIENALRSAQGFFSNKESALASEQVAAVLALDPENSAALKLKDSIRLTAGMNEAIPAQTSAETALANIRVLKEKWAGYRGEFDRLETELKNGDKFLDQREYGVAMEHYGIVKTGCSELENKEKLRLEAVGIREQMEAARKAAEKQNVMEMSKNEWSKASDLALSADKNFAAGQFQDASIGWKNATASFENLGKFAAAITEYKKAQTAYNRARHDASYDTADLQKYAPVEYAAAEAAAQNGDMSTSDPIFGRKNYETALAKFTAAVKIADPFLLPQLKVNSNVGDIEARVQLNGYTGSMAGLERTRQVLLKNYGENHPYVKSVDGLLEKYKTLRSLMESYGENHPEVTRLETEIEKIKKDLSLQWVQSEKEPLVLERSQRYRLTVSKKEYVPFTATFVADWVGLKDLPVVLNSRQIIYSVKKGDTLSSIAMTYGISEREIAVENKITNPNKLTLGQKLIISPRDGWDVSPAMIDPAYTDKVPVLGDIPVIGRLFRVEGTRVSSKMGSRPSNSQKEKDGAGIPLSVRGEVKNPGAFPLSRGATLADAITAAGGVTDFANAKKVELARGNKKLVCNLRAGESPILEPGDIITVPRSFY